MRDRHTRRPGNRPRTAAAPAAAILILGAASFILAGCGDGGSTSGASAGASVTAASSAPAGSTTAPAGGTTTTSGGGATTTTPGGQGAPVDPKQAITSAIDAVLASGDPALACERYATAKYVGTTFGSRGGCVHSTVPASAADSVEVSAIRISGTTAKATAVPSGGPSDGEKISVDLVNADGVWKVDSLQSNVPVGP